MAKEAFDKIMAGLEDALAYTKGDTTRGVTHVVEVTMPDVKTIRGKLGMSQSAFARAIRVSTGTLQGWEQHRRRPDGPALALLEVVDKEPEAVLRALAGS